MNYDDLLFLPTFDPSIIVPIWAGNIWIGTSGKQNGFEAFSGYPQHKLNQSARALHPTILLKEESVIPLPPTNHTSLPICSCCASRKLQPNSAPTPVWKHATALHAINAAVISGTWRHSR